MISVLKLNNPTIIFVLSIVLLLLVRIVLIYEPIDVVVWQINAAPFSYLLYNAIPNLISNAFFNYTISAIIILFLAFSINSLLNQNKILGSSNYFAAWMFVVISSLHTSFILLSPPLIALLISFFLFKEIYNLKLDKVYLGSLFKVGMLLSISFLFYYSSAMLLILVFVGLFIFSKFSFRFILVFFIGMSIPFIYFVFYFFWIDELHREFIKTFSFFEISLISFTDLFKTQNWVIFPLFIFAIAGLYALLNKSQKVVKEIRQFNSLLVLFSALYFFAVIFQSNNSQVSFVPLLFPFVVYIVMQINTFKRKMIAELTHLSLLLQIVFNLIVALK